MTRATMYPLAEDGLGALEMIQSDPHRILVLLDIWLPGMDGIEVLKTVKTYHPEIEVSDHVRSRYDRHCGSGNQTRRV